MRWLNALLGLQAYDIEEMRYVACKIHQLVPHWSEDHKRSYVRHAVRVSHMMCAGQVASDLYEHDASNAFFRRRVSTAS